MTDRSNLTALNELQTLANGRASNKLGDNYRRGEEVEQSWEEALHWYKLGAEQGDAQAQNNLGSMFLDGIGCPSDKALAVAWYRKSADQGCAAAQYNLAKRYLDGSGVDRDYDEARHWMSLAVQQNYAEAVCDLGAMMYLGQGGEANLSLAATMWIAAADMGDTKALSNLSEYAPELQELTLTGDQEAALRMCAMHNRGLGVAQSQALTWTWIVCAKRHCAPSGDAPIVEEVNETFEFYDTYIDDDEKKEGEGVLLKLLSEKTAASRTVQ